MQYNGLRGFIDEVERVGELRVARGCDVDQEVGAVTELAQHRINGPAVLFDEIQGYQPGHRIFINSLGSPSRTALALGLPTGLAYKELVPLWRKRMKEERAGVRISGNHLAQGILEVRARLFFRPRGFSRGQHLKTENPVR